MRGARSHSASSASHRRPCESEVLSHSDSSDARDAFRGFVSPDEGGAAAALPRSSRPRPVDDSAVAAASRRA